VKVWPEEDDMYDVAVAEGYCPDCEDGYCCGEWDDAAPDED
jgi:hypothetical protein